MGHKDKRLYNYVINTLGVTKELIMNYVDARVEEVLKKHIASKLDSKYVERLILDQVTEVVEKGIPMQSGLYYTRKDFDTYLKKVLKAIVEEKLLTDYVVDLKLTQKENNVVRKI